MKIRPRRYPYPVITPFEITNEKYDFSCKLTMEENIELSILHLNVDFQIKNAVLKKLVQEKKAIFALHLECPSTMKRLLFKTNNPQDSFEVAIADLNKTVDINFFILADVAIQDYTNTEIDPYSEGFTFELVKGDLLAIGPPETLELEKEPIVEMNSIFELIPTHDKNAKPLMIDLSSDKIRIHLPKESFEMMSYIHAATISRADTILAAIYYTPAMVEALYQIRDAYTSEDDMRVEDIRDTAWFKSIRARLHHINIDIEHLPSDNIIGIAHEMLDDPNQKAMAYIKEELIGGDYEE
ncbi:hypothetical protein JSQ81_11485 [Sporosarcina sp. Marseille-Q4063]|uniref:hypothetical protein n=1 Tax=Sporosarcina sp. Marseille-Q4063 TaxID=2810514 RepID=UPI001BAF90EB|nr:hypothetical protein [Sporosarcina sp. Marseille-Q4063]QUW20483.1 hypothetical protein JSQ81_11485 [Sporosarcina sp. Marseille-Q4063]